MSARAIATLLLLAALAAPARGQLSGKAASEGNPALGDDSTNVRDGSRPVHERGRTVRETSAGRLGGRSVHGSGPIGLNSGSVSDSSQGAVSDHGREAPPPAPRVEPIGAADLERLTETIRAIRPLPRDEAPDPAVEPTPIP
jgi:hypothetical protein